MIRSLSTLLILGLQGLWAQEINEDDLFSDAGSLIVESETLESKFSIPSEGLHPSGSISAQNASIFMRDSAHPTLSSQIVANLFLDARSADGTKAFAAIEGIYLADSNKQEAHLRELFLDFDFGKRVYIRAGKQVLQWGRCYFWNPSDLINVEKKQFVERAGSLEGVYGIRTHIPFGTRANIYGFWDLDGATSLQESKGTVKAEVLVGPTESALSIWKRQGLNPVYAWDISTPLGQWSVSGEAALFPEGFTRRYEIRRDTLFDLPSKAFSAQAALSLGRTFDILEVKDRLRVQYEMFYNGLGYTENPIADSYWYPWNGTSLDGPKVLWMYQSGQLQNYSLGRYYAAFFTSFSRFFHPDLSLSANGVMNLIDRSWMLSSGLDFSTLHNLRLQALFVRMGGEYPAEMTIFGQEWRIQITAEYSF